MPKSGATRWFVRWHQQPGYQVTMTKSWNDTWVSEGANNTTTSTGEVTIEFLVAGVILANPGQEWSTPRALLDWTASSSGTRIHLDGDSDAEGECYGDCSCSFTWSDEWSGRTVADAREGESGEWLLYDFWFEGSEIADEGGDGEWSCAEREAGSYLNRGLYDFELPLVDGSYSITDTNRNPTVTWTIDVELIGPMPTRDGT